MIGGDTYTTRETWNCAREAAGAACVAVEAILDGTVKNALSLVRPPGHHAGYNSIEGFCLINNIAVAARHAQEKYGVQRIAIIDFDVHHGNGTQDIFYDDPSVLFISSHMFSPWFYPGSGGFAEFGRGKGMGWNMNIPLPPGVGDRGYERVFERIIEPAVEMFRPELILVSAGFDAHWRDPLAQMQLSIFGYAALCKRLIALAHRVCHGRAAFVLEGGYDIAVLGYSVENLLYAMLLRHHAVDPIGKSAESECEIDDLLVKLEQQHLPG